MNKLRNARKYWPYYIIIAFFSIISLVVLYVDKPEMVTDLAYSEEFTDNYEIAIGVLANRGIDQCMAQWGATADYLNEKIPNHHFTIVPLGFDTIDEAVCSEKSGFCTGELLHVYGDGGEIWGQPAGYHEKTTFWGKPFLILAG